MNETNLPQKNDRDWQQAEMARDEAFRLHEVEETFKRLYHESNDVIGKFDEIEKDWELLARELGILSFYKSL